MGNAKHRPKCRRLAISVISREAARKELQPSHRRPRMRAVASSGVPIPQGTHRLKDSSESTAWTVPELLRTVALRGQHPAVIVSGAEGVAVWTCEAIAQASMALAQRLRRDGIDHSKRIALWAPNSPQWIIVALAVMAAGGVLVPIDDLAQAAELEAALDCCGARLIFISARHLADFKDVLHCQGCGSRPRGCASRHCNFHAE